MVSGVELTSYALNNSSSPVLVTFQHEDNYLLVLWIIAFLLLLLVLDKLLNRYLRW